MRGRIALSLIAAAAAAACSSSGSHAPGYGSTHTERLRRPPLEAAHCFARNAQDHSSALDAQVQATENGGAHVLVQVKNGITYATADLRPRASGSVAMIALAVRSSGGQRDLLDALIAGC